MPNDLYESTVEVIVSSDLIRSLRQSSAQKACLVVIAGPKLGQRTVLGDASLSIGRGSACGLQLDADSVSRNHARVEFEEGCHYLVDLNSTNGTYLNDARVSRMVLRDGDRLGIGKCTLKYLASSNIEFAYHEEVQRLVRHDGLTGVFNKAHFDETYATLVARTRAQGQPLSVLVFDLDHFKRVNDTYGHPAGDAVLRQVAAAVQAEVGDAHLFARVGGEEFSVVAMIPLAHALQLAEQLRAAVERAECLVEGRRIPVTLSVGVAERPAGSDEVGERLYERADAQLYQAKSAGRNRVC